MHRNFGVYGVCMSEGKLLVIKKTLGPYYGRYDLPGGNIELDETIFDCLHREYAEETGSEIQFVNQIGVSEYIVPYPLQKRGTTHIHHIAIFYDVKFKSGNLDSDSTLKNNDSSGAVWININELNENNASPLIQTMLNWIKDPSRPISVSVQNLSNWKVNA